MAKDWNLTPEQRAYLHRLGIVLERQHAAVKQALEQAFGERERVWAALEQSPSAWDNIASQISRLDWTGVDWTEVNRLCLEAVEEFDADREDAQELDEESKRAMIRLVELVEGSPQRLPVEPEPDKAERAKRRAELLAKWEMKDSRHKRSHLYASEPVRIPNPDEPTSPIISKSQFYPWLHGDLHMRATAAVRLEFYLQQNT